MPGDVFEHASARGLPDWALEGRGASAPPLARTARFLEAVLQAIGLDRQRVIAAARGRYVAAWDELVRSGRAADGERPSFTLFVRSSAGTWCSWHPLRSFALPTRRCVIDCLAHRAVASPHGGAAQSSLSEADAQLAVAIAAAFRPVREARFGLVAEVIATDFVENVLDFVGGLQRTCAALHRCFA